MDYQQMGFANVILPVYAPYSIGEHRGERIIIGTRSESPNYCSPLLVMKDIINESISISSDPRNEDRILDFCNKYGLIGVCMGYKAHHWHNKIEYLMEISWLSNLQIAFDLLTPHLLCGFRYTASFSMIDPSRRPTWNKKREEQVEKWAKRFTEIDGPCSFSIIDDDVGIFAQYLTGFLSDSALIAKLAEAIRSDTEEYVDGFKRRMISSQIDSWLEGVNMRCQVKGSSYLNTYGYNTLCQAMGIYFNQLVLRGNGLKRCEGCGCLFEPTRKGAIRGQKHCPVDPDDPNTYVKTKKGLLSRCKVNHDMTERTKNRRKNKHRGRSQNGNEKGEQS